MTEDNQQAFREWLLEQADLIKPSGNSGLLGSRSIERSIEKVYRDRFGRLSDLMWGIFWQDIFNLLDEVACE